MLEKCHMQDNQPVAKIDKKINSSSPPRGGPPKKNPPHSFEERLRAVKLHLEEGFTQEMVAQEMGLSSAAVYKWAKRYRLYGQEGLKSQHSGQSRARLAEAVRNK